MCLIHTVRNKESDRGGYMCQINTVPMKSQIGYLDVLVPPDILVNESSSDVIVNEGSDVTLRCRARVEKRRWRENPIGGLAGKALYNKQNRRRKFKYNSSYEEPGFASLQM
ncbi:unnamed protein product, partial [Oppiella nova]